MNEDINEENDDFLEKKMDFKEDFDNKFEPIDETCEEENDFDIFIPRDELDNIHKTYINEFVPQKNNNKGTNSIGKYNRFSEDKGIKTLQKLYSDGVRKECGRCHQVKPITHFVLRRGKLKPYPKSTCKKCDLIIKQIYALSNKYKIMENIYNRKLKGKCQECDTGVTMLPALEFHHLDPSLKKTTWHSQMYKNWEKTMEKLEKEKVTILCRNCHFKKRSNIYNKYEEIIQGKEFWPNSTNKEIQLYVNRKISHPHQFRLQNQVALHIKKRIIINQLYLGKCVGCKQITTQNNLPTLNFHHRNKSNLYRSNVWNKINHLKLKQIKSELINQNCVSLCGNCHQLINSYHFKNHNENIIGPGHSDHIKLYYQQIMRNIRDFKFE